MDCAEEEEINFFKASRSDARKYQWKVFIICLFGTNATDRKSKSSYVIVTWISKKGNPPKNKFQVSER